MKEPPSKSRSKGSNSQLCRGAGLRKAVAANSCSGGGAVPAARGGGVASAERAEQLSGAPDPSRMEELVAPGAGSPPANGNGNGGGKGKQASPKGREVFRSQRRESEVRSPGSFCWGREVPAGGKRRLRGCGPVPLPHPEPTPPPRERAPAGVPLSGLWARTPLLPSRWGLSSPLASAPGDVRDLERPGTFQILFISLAAAAAGGGNSYLPLTEEQTGSGRWRTA